MHRASQRYAGEVIYPLYKVSVHNDDVPASSP